MYLLAHAVLFKESVRRHYHILVSVWHSHWYTLNQTWLQTNYFELMYYNLLNKALNCSAVRSAAFLMCSHKQGCGKIIAQLYTWYHNEGHAQTEAVGQPGNTRTTELFTRVTLFYSAGNLLPSGRLTLQYKMQWSNIL